MKINGARALTLLERAVAERGEDYKDPNAEALGCQYVNDGKKPGCIVGLALNLGRVPLRTLSLLDCGGTSSAIAGATADGTSSQTVLAFAGVHMDDNAIEILAAAQQLQDNQQRWGDALAAAREEAERRGCIK